MATIRTPLLQDTSSLRSSSTQSLSAFERQAESKRREVTRYVAFYWAVICCLCAGSITAFSLYAPLFQERLRYNQLQVNAVSIAAELGLYLPVGLVGYICDRTGPAILSFISAILFGSAYLLAAFTYQSGAKDVSGYTHERGWPLWVMILAFAVIGLATTFMYVSAITTCAKNFGKGKYRGLALACPMAAFGLSAMWLSQLGEKVLYERLPSGEKGDVDVFKLFLFLAITLLTVGLLGTFLLKVVDERELIDEAVEELERSGQLEESEFFRRGNGRGHSGTVDERLDNESAEASMAEPFKTSEQEETRKKIWLLNEGTRLFFSDPTMWLLATAFFFISGPGEAFVTNVGTVVRTLYPPVSTPTDVPTSAATHVSIIAITSTVARILFGTITDLLAPASLGHHYQSASNSLASLPPRNGRFVVSRVAFLIGTALLLSLGQVILASGAIQNHGERFWIVSSLIGSGYGALFSLTPLIISVIWGVENFGTNWGMVAMVPAFGATVWGIFYSAVYQWGARNSASGYDVNTAEEVMCYGKQCYAITFWSMAISVWVGCGILAWAWKGRGGWSERGIAV